MTTVTADPRDDPVQFIVQGLMAVFFGDPKEQIVWSLIFGAGAYISALFSFGATVLLVVLFSLTFLVGTIRYVYRSVTE